MNAATDRTPAVQEEETITADRTSPCYQSKDPDTPCTDRISVLIFFVPCSVPVPVPRNGTTAQ